MSQCVVVLCRVPACSLEGDDFKNIYYYNMDKSIGNGPTGVVVDNLSFVIDQDNIFAASSPGLT